MLDILYQIKCYTLYVSFLPLKILLNRYTTAKFMHSSPYLLLFHGHTHTPVKDTHTCTLLLYRSTLWHGKDINHSDSIIINEFPKHETHHLHRNTSTT